MANQYTSSLLNGYQDSGIEIDYCTRRYLNERPLQVDPYGHIAQQLSRRISEIRARIDQLMGKPVITSEIRASLRRTIDDLTSVGEHGSPTFEESTLVIADPEQLISTNLSRGSVTWPKLWHKALQQDRSLPHVRKCTENGDPIVIGYKTISSGDTDEPLQAKLRYNGPDELGEYVEALFKELLPELIAYEDVMRRYELREAKESLMAGVKGAIPYVIGGIVGDILSRILLDPTGQTYKTFRKIFEVPIRYIQGNSDTFQQFLHVRRRKQEKSEVDKTYQAVRASLIASSAGPIAMIGLPLLGVDITTWQYFIAVTLAASADNLSQALTKARANYLEAKDKGLIGANRDDPTVSGNLLGTTSIALIDLVLRAVAEATGTNSVLGYFTSIAGESGVLGPFDSEVAALMTSRRQNTMRRSKWAPKFSADRLSDCSLRNIK